MSRVDLDIWNAMDTLLARIMDQKANDTWCHVVDGTLFIGAKAHKILASLDIMHFINYLATARAHEMFKGMDMGDRRVVDWVLRYDDTMVEVMASSGFKWLGRMFLQHVGNGMAAFMLEVLGYRPGVKLTGARLRFFLRARLMPDGRFVAPGMNALQRSIVEACIADIEETDDVFAFLKKVHKRMHEKARRTVHGGIVPRVRASANG